MRDATYRFVLKRELKSWLGMTHSYEESAIGKRKGTDFEIMTAQLSVDLIYAILYSITEHTVGIKKSEDFKNYQQYDFTNKNVVLIEYMIVKNPSKIELKIGEENEKVELARSGTKELALTKMKSSSMDIP